MKNLKMIKFVMVSAVALLFATACTNNTKTENNTNPSTEQTTKENQYTSNASFYLGKDGKAIQEKDIDKNATVVNWYVDPYCPACVQLEELTKDTIKEYINNKNVVINYNVLSFLSARTVDDYSNRAAGWILGVINERPDLAYDYFTNVLSVNFHTNGKAKEDSAFKDLFIKLGGKEDEWKNIESKKKDLIEEVKSNKIRVFNDNELAKKSPTGKLFTPFIIVGDSEKAIDFEHGDNPLEQLKKEIDSKLK